MHKATLKSHQKQAEFLEAYGQTPSVVAACEQIGVAERTVYDWAKRYPEFGREFQKVQQEKAKRAAAVQRASAQSFGMVYDHRRELPPKGTFTEWRRRYIGRQVEDHQQELVQAYEDRTNLVVISLLPPGAGKDTTAGDFLLYETCDNRDLRAAWIMRGETFAKRRVGERLDPYLTDPRTYEGAPPGPTSVQPEASLITDYGPFKYKKGMIDGNGEKLEPSTWTKNEIYFLKPGAPEADPNLWATGMEGQLYGSRIDLLVVSDVFDRENQLTETARQSQYAWLMGTAMSRLDESGRLIVLGTRCLPGDNYERMIDELVGDAAVVHQGRHYTKYANGVAVVIMPAISVDDNGDEESYWPDRFPLDSQFVLPDGTRVEADIDDPQLVTQLQQQHGPHLKRIRGLREIRERNRELFDTMYQQNPPDIVTGDFTDETLNRADDDNRTFGVYRSNELIVIGADPARSAGAAWVAWGVDRENETITVIDSFFGTKLGIGGLKSKLVVAPITTYQPLAYCYEVNREAAVIEDPEIERLFDDFGVKLVRHQTHHANRTNSTIGVPSLSFYMRNGTIRFPAQTAEDRARSNQIKEHFKTWDRKEAMDTHRKHLKGQPDDLAMAAWVGFIEALALLNKKRNRTTHRQMPVPDSVQRQWDRMQQRRRDKQYIDERERGSQPSMKELVSLVLGGDT